MTLLLIILDPHTFLLHNSELPGTTLAERIRVGDRSFAAWAGLWLPEAPPRVLTYGSLLVIPAGETGLVQPASRPSQPVMQFSEREVQILEGLMEGLTLKEIADRLGCGERTIRCYTGRLQRKLKGRTLAETVGRAAALEFWKRKK